MIVDPGVIHVLIVDDEPAVASVLGRSLEISGFRVTQVTSAEDALEHLRKDSFEAIITDLHMPRMQGDELLRRVRAIDESAAVILITAAGDLQCAVRCLQEGASDYIAKPFDLKDVGARLQNALERRALELEQKRLLEENLTYQFHLQRLVEEQSVRLKSTFHNSLQTLNYAIEAKDETTRNHSHRVAMVAVALARACTNSSEEFVGKLRLAAELHDIGKIGVPEAILVKAGPLSPKEFDLIKKHPEIGENILRPLFDDEDILGIVRSHHEQWNGDGYPDGLAGDEIPFGARIVAVSDAYDAMISARPYRKGMPPEEALVRLEEGAGTQWDLTVVQAMLKLASSGRLFSLTQEASQWTPAFYVVEEQEPDLPSSHAA